MFFLEHRVVCIALLLFDYNGQLLEHAICLVGPVLLSLYCIVIVFLNEINGDGDGDMAKPHSRDTPRGGL